MVSITDEVLNRVDNLGFSLDSETDYIILNFLIKRNLVTLVGQDRFFENEVDIMTLKDNIIILLGESNDISIKAVDNRLVFGSKNFNLVISKLSNHLESESVYSVNRNVFHEIIKASDLGMEIKRYSNEKILFDVKAKNIGVVKTGTSLYEVTSSDDKKEKSFLANLAKVIKDDNIIRLKEDIYRKDLRLYEDLYNSLESKYMDTSKKYTMKR